MDNAYIVEVENLNKAFAGKPAVIDLSLKIKKGEIFGFLGPNGSGKTTTIRMLCGLLTPDSGKGVCLGYDITTQSSFLKPLVGYVPQVYSLYRDLTVRENLEFIARVYGHHDYKARVKKISDDLELGPYLNIFSGQLSGGWKQRVSLAAALIHDPQLLLLDEPTASIDPKARREFWAYISQLSSRGITSLVSTHYMDEAERCNRLGYIVYGRLMAEGTIPEIIKKVGLITWAAKGPDLPYLAKQLKEDEHIEQVIMWGNELRICGWEIEGLENAMKRFDQYEWTHVATSLEEVFIHLVDERYEGEPKNRQ